ncbi:hypothetical protein [Nakamurella endophytica]|uniref:Transmembrane protein n=1 Tax=Nakamurella endophytica TaxID=1748367 RepID=A0A917SW06_9ACTN|nr:hypothetical protein [Nakamurella endophytica]GGL98813.1 hypothetical protein GCM10011594_18410 [Nakamurella endophytica]
MSEHESSGIDPEDLERFARAAAEQLRGAFGQFGRLFEGTGGTPSWSGLFDDAGRRPRSRPEPETTGATGDGVWVVYTVDGSGSARIEQVYAAELDALRANRNNTDESRKVRFLPYGMPVSVLDTPEDGAEA